VTGCYMTSRSRFCGLFLFAPFSLFVQLARSRCYSYTCFVFLIWSRLIRSDSCQKEMLRRSRGGQNYSFSHGELLNNKYRLASLLGSGSFSQVVRAQDLTNREVDVAVKIVKTGNPYQHQASVEMNILRELHAKDPLDEYNIVRMVGSFTHLGHQCIVFERLSINLYQYLKNTRSPTNHNRYHGVSLNLVRTFGRQLLEVSRHALPYLYCFVTHLYTTFALLYRALTLLHYRLLHSYPEPMLA
jgi:serine/threonine protein kinase